jgi:hypothetical protein
VRVVNDMPEPAAGTGQAAGRPPAVSGDTGASQHSSSPISGGQGLRGMSERMASVGGTFSAGPVGSQWRVEAQVSA